LEYVLKQFSVSEPKDNMHKNNNSFFQRQQQQHPSAHVASNPVRNNFGGYLRSPFHVATDILGDAKVASGTAKRAVELSGDIQESAAAAAERPWVRAGVGAGRLSVKEKNEQLYEAKQIYGDWGDSRSNQVEATSAKSGSVNPTADAADVPIGSAAHQSSSSHPSQTHHLSSAQEEKRYIHRTVGESKMLPKLLPSGVGAASQKKRQRDDVHDAAEDTTDHNEDKVIRPYVPVTPRPTDAGGVTEADAQPHDQPSGKAVNATTTAGGAVQASPAVSKRQELEKKRLEALYGGKKRR
jgi:hypothetical protein